MTRDEFLNRLGELLACLPADQVKETQEFYAEAIADRMEDGMTEAEAVIWWILFRRKPAMQEEMRLSI